MSLLSENKSYWTGRAAFAEGPEREALEEVFLEAAPGLRKIYDKTPGKRMMCFTLEDARAELIPLMPPGEILLDETDDSWDKTFPLSDKVEHEKVSFHNRYGITLAADLYRPKGAEGKLPAVAVSGPFGAVKEQSSGLYAQHLAENGFLAIAFDPSFTGESGGTPRRMASPDINTEDFLAAVDYLSVRDDVDPEKIGILGICGFGGMAVNAAALDPRIKATVDMTTKYPNVKIAAKRTTNSGGDSLDLDMQMAAIPETLEEKYELRGEKWHCEDCPYYEKSTDKRVKYTHCQVGDKRAYAKCPACERFYEVLERGE